MARIRETLWEAKRPAESEPRTIPFVALKDRQQSQDRVSERSESAEPVEVPFIEVGGPGSAIEASPSVLALLTETRPVSRPASASSSESKPPVRPQGIANEIAPLPTRVEFHKLPPRTAVLEPAENRFSRELVCFHDPEHAVSIQYTHVLDEILAKRPRETAEAILFSSASCTSATTSAVLNLAVCQARRSSRPLIVVDADLHGRRIAQMLGLPAAVGLCDVLEGQVALQKAIQETGVAQLHALTAGKKLADVVGLLASEAMRAVVRHLREFYALVFIAAGSWDGRPDLVALSASCQRTFLVLDHKELETENVRDLFQVLPKQGVVLGGCICLTR